jgi:hypothetical protein
MPINLDAEAQMTVLTPRLPAFGLTTAGASLGTEAL